MNYSRYAALHARHLPDKVCLIERTPSVNQRRTLTWKAFNEAINRMANYLSNELEYLKLLELDNYFSTDHFEKFLSDLPNPLTFHMENLRKEIVAIQTAQVQTLRNEPVEIPPVRSPASRWEKFLQIWKHSGFKIALKTAIGALKRGH